MDQILRFPDPDSSGRTARGSSGPRILSIDRIDYRTARSRADLAGAFRLLQQRYAAVGLSCQDAPDMRVLPYHLWDQTQVFVALKRGEVIGSVSLVRDGKHGIPMESTYASAVAALRGQGLRVGEVGSLTVESSGAESSGELFRGLTRLMLFQARYLGLDNVLAVVHPRHAKFYQLAMGFERIGGVSQYDQVGGQPGIAILGSVNDRLSYGPRWRSNYFDGTYTDAELKPRPMSAADRDFFRHYLTQNEPIRRRRAG